MFSSAIQTRATELAEELAEKIVNEKLEEASRNGQQQGFRTGRNARPVESLRAGAAPSSDGRQVSKDTMFRGLLTGDNS